MVERHMQGTGEGRRGGRGAYSRPSLAIDMGTVSTFHLSQREVIRTELARPLRRAFQNDKGKPSEILRALWPYLQMMRLFGFFPNTGSMEDLHFSWFHAVTFYSAFLLVNELFLTGIQMEKSLEMFRDRRGGVTAVVDGIMNLVYSIHVSGVGFVGLWRARSFPRWFRTCRETEAVLGKYRSPGDRTVLQCWLVTALSLGLSIITSTLYFVSIGVRSHVHSWDEYLKEVSRVYLDDIMISFASGYYTLVLGCLMDVVWAVGDTLLLLLAISHRVFFRRINRAIQNLENSVPRPELVEELRSHHIMVVDLVQTADEIFSPLTFLTYISLTTYLFCRLYLSMTQDMSHPSPLMLVEGSLAFCQLLARIFLPSYYAASMHEEAHKASMLLSRWGMVVTPEEDSRFLKRLLLVQRFQLQLASISCGFTGCGFFIITKGFVTGLVSALITYEIIILQFHKGFVEEENPRLPQET